MKDVNYELRCIGTNLDHFPDISGQRMGRQHDGSHRVVWPGLPPGVHGPVGRGRQLGVQLRLDGPGELEVRVPEVHGLLDVGCLVPYLLRESGDHGHAAAAGCARTARKSEKVWGEPIGVNLRSSIIRCCSLASSLVLYSHDRLLLSEAKSYRS